MPGSSTCSNATTDRAPVLASAPSPPLGDCHQSSAISQDPYGLSLSCGSAILSSCEDDAPGTSGDHYRVSATPPFFLPDCGQRKPAATFASTTSSIGAVRSPSARRHREDEAIYPPRQASRGRPRTATSPGKRTAIAYSADLDIHHQCGESARVPSHAARDVERALRKVEQYESSKNQRKLRRILDAPPPLQRMPTNSSRPGSQRRKNRLQSPRIDRESLATEPPFRPLSGRFARAHGTTEASLRQERGPAAADALPAALAARLPYPEPSGSVHPQVARLMAARSGKAAGVRRPRTTSARGSQRAVQRLDLPYIHVQ